MRNQLQAAVVYLMIVAFCLFFGVVGSVAYAPDHEPIVNQPNRCSKPVDAKLTELCGLLPIRLENANVNANIGIAPSPRTPAPAIKLVLGKHIALRVVTKP